MRLINRLRYHRRQNSLLGFPWSLSRLGQHMFVSRISNRKVPEEVFSVAPASFKRLFGSGIWQDGKHTLREILFPGDLCAFASTWAGISIHESYLVLFHAYGDTRVVYVYDYLWRYWVFMMSHVIEPMK